MACPQEYIDDPLQVVEACFNEVVSKAEKDGETVAHMQWDVASKFGDLYSPENYERIPILTRDAFDKSQLPHNSLVRFRGMVQDFFNMEYYLGVVYGPHNHLISCKYRDAVPPSVDTSKEITGEFSQRLPVYCVPVPWETEWSRSAFQDQFSRPTTNTAQSPSQRKRPADDDEMAVDNDENSQTQATSDGNHAAKKSKDVDNMDEDDGATHPGTTFAKRKFLQYAFEFPNPDEQCMPCIVKFPQDGKEWGPDGVSEMIEVVGVLSLQHELAGGDGSSAGTDLDENSPEHLLMLEDQAQLPANSVVPRIHAISFRGIKGPTVPSSIPQTLPVADLRSSLVSHLSDAVFHGDAFAAEYALLWMLSTVYSRPAPGFTLGKLSLGVSSPAHAPLNGTTFSSICQQLLQRVQMVPLGLETLNSKSFAPTKDNQANRLRTGRLQMCHGTHLIVDETTLESGQLNGVGLRNLELLKQVSQQQLLSYDFGFFQNEWKVDYPTLVISNTPKPLVPSDLHVLVEPRTVVKPGAPCIPIPSQLAQDLRQYLLACRSRVNGFAIPEALTAHLQQDFVQARQADRSVQEADFHLWMTLARLVCVSHGEDELSQARWGQMREMERARKGRLPNLRVDTDARAPQAAAQSPSSVMEMAK